MDWLLANGDPLHLIIVVASALLYWRHDAAMRESNTAVVAQVVGVTKSLEALMHFVQQHDSRLDRVESILMSPRVEFVSAKDVEVSDVV